MKLSLSIVVITYNCEPFIKRFLDDLLKSLENFTHFEILLHDNDSKDRTKQILEAYDTRIALYNNANIGFSKANNFLIQKSKFKNILLLNPDVFGFSSTFWTSLYDRWDFTNPLFIKLINEDGSYQDTIADFISIKRMVLSLLRLKPDYNRLNTQTSIEASIMAFLLITKECLCKVGLLNESFFMYSEDIEWCYRARKAGYDNRYEPELQLTHMGGASSKSQWDHTTIMKKKYLAESKFIQMHYRGINKIILTVINYLKMISV